MIKTLRNQVIALAGLSQAVYLVQNIARRGMADREDTAASIGSVLKIDSGDVVDVYGGLHRIATGIKQIEKQLGGPDVVDPEQARYASTLIFLERKLMKQPQMLDTIRAAMEKASALAAERGVLDEEVLATLAHAYQQTVSQLTPRVLVTGEQMYLSDPENGNRIRSLLLAGIRSVVLWRRCGGSRWKLLFIRPKLQQEARQLLESLSRT
ncbi:high frequency lysogenization protein HflD [Methylocaldum szegediense]|uniref:High frequency lysogenization protein HflD homolog n=1 Tax=Methylocaldum szegediense TaxID=73780 RepID=A0ABM9I7T0_9GAMM|nr:high frequency lysogenization protein HflD [Methylocaldum szegediense]CAI8947710.1 High frequency lysogenization protein HflD homolog [Methylocaldum szegediense]